MAENENINAGQEAEVVLKQEVTTDTEIEASVEKEVVQQPESITAIEPNVAVKATGKKKFNVLSIVILAALGLALLMGIVGLCIDWLSVKAPNAVTLKYVKGADTLKEVINLNKLYNGNLYNGLEAIEAFAIIAIIMSAFTAASLVISKFINIKWLKYVTAGLSALLIISALLTLILTATCANTELSIEMKNSNNLSYAPDAGPWLLAAFGTVAGVLGLIGALDESGAKSKEFLRKQVVKLKRRPMNIGLFVLLISTIVILCSLGNLSQLGLTYEYQKQYQGLCIFISILFGILVLLLYMNAFPKRNKKPKLVMYILTIVFMLILIGLDIYLYVIWGKNRADDLLRDSTFNYWFKDPGINNYYFEAVNSVLVHAILVAASLVLMVLSPFIGKLLNKIDTSVQLEENKLKSKIDIEED